MKIAVALRHALTGRGGATIADNSAMLAQRTLKSMTVTRSWSPSDSSYAVP